MGVRVIVVGAGAFGGWTALWCRRRGAEVTLLDMYGPGNVRASSGGETRLIRCGYGPAAEFTELAAKASQWWNAEQAWLGGLFWRTGLLWLFHETADGYAAATRENLRRHEVPYQRLELTEVARRWPQFRREGVVEALFEPEAGFAFARATCARVAAQLVREGGRHECQRVISPDEVAGRSAGRRLRTLWTHTEETSADQYVFACGPWLAQLFPGALAGRLRVTRQETYSWAVPYADWVYWRPECMPCWIEYKSKILYGVPAHDSASIKTGLHVPGPDFDPERGERALSPEGIAAGRGALEQTFGTSLEQPATLLGGEVCQYELAPDERPFCLRHPRWDNVWLLGGGSGHGFKLGPEIGRRAAARVLEEAA